MELATSSGGGNGGKRERRPPSIIAGHVIARRPKEKTLQETEEPKMPPQFTGQKIGGAKNFLSQDEFEVEEDPKSDQSSERTLPVGLEMMRPAPSPSVPGHTSHHVQHKLSAPRGWYRAWTPVTWSYVGFEPPSIGPIESSKDWVFFQERWLKSDYSPDILVSSFCKQCYDSGIAETCFPKLRGHLESYLECCQTIQHCHNAIKKCMFLVTFRAEPDFKDYRWRRLEQSRLAVRGTSLEIPSTLLPGNPVPQIGDTLDDAQRHLESRFHHGKFSGSGQVAFTFKPQFQLRRCCGETLPDEGEFDPLHLDYANPSFPDFGFLKCLRSDSRLPAWVEDSQEMEGKGGHLNRWYPWSHSTSQAKPTPPLEPLCVHSTRSKIMQSRSLKVLGDVTYKRRAEDEPSWSLSSTPRFERPRRSETLAVREQFRADNGADLNLPLLAPKDSRDSTLLVQGYDMDGVDWADDNLISSLVSSAPIDEEEYCETSPLGLNNEADLDIRPYSMRWIWTTVQRRLSLGPCHAGIEETWCECQDALDMMLRTMTCGEWDYWSRRRTGRRRGEGRAHLCDAMYGSFAAHWTAATGDPAMTQFCGRIRNLLLSLQRDRRRIGFDHHLMTHSDLLSLFIPTSGAIGLCSPDARRGDRLVILFGCRTPVVLRQIPRETDASGKDLPTAWRFIGECYVDSLMDGSAVKKRQDSGEPVQTFTLC